MNVLIQTRTWSLEENEHKGFPMVNKERKNRTYSNGYYSSHHGSRSQFIIVDQKCFCFTKETCCFRQELLFHGR